MPSGVGAPGGQSAERKCGLQCRNPKTAVDGKRKVLTLHHQLFTDYRGLYFQSGCVVSKVPSGLTLETMVVHFLVGYIAMVTYAVHLTCSG